MWAPRGTPWPVLVEEDAADPVEDGLEEAVVPGGVDEEAEALCSTTAGTEEASQLEQK